MGRVMTNPLDTQIGGDHYKKLKIQPMEYSMANKLDACQHTAIKYITRFRDKGGIADLEKARHCVDMLIEFERRSLADGDEKIAPAQPKLVEPEPHRGGTWYSYIPNCPCPLCRPNAK
jgi:hypothetical protein